MDETNQTKPIGQSYKVNEMLFAGEYPGDKNSIMAESKIKQMLDFGIRHFIDLTEEGELNPYNQLLPEGTTYFRFPIRDCSVPHSVEGVDHLLCYVEECIRRKELIYLHCWGGVGRTGTIIACYLAKQMENPTLQIAVADLRLLFESMPKAAYRETPETKEQIEFINNFIGYLNNKSSQNKVVNCRTVPENITHDRKVTNETAGMIIHPIPIKSYEEDASKMENMTDSEKMKFMKNIKETNRYKVEHQSPEIGHLDYILNTDSKNHHKIAISEKTFAIVAKTRLYSSLYAWGLDFDREILSVVAKDCCNKDYPYGQFVVLLDDGTIYEIWSESCIKPVFQNNYFCAVACGCGGLVFGLRSDGRVEVGNNQRNEELADEVSKWTDIVQIDAGPQHVVGLTKDNKVVAAGKPSACEPLRKWENIKRIYVSKMSEVYGKVNALTFGIDWQGWLHVDGDTWKKGSEFWKKIRAQYDVTDVIEDGSCVWIRTWDKITRAITYYSTMNYHEEIDFVKRYPDFRYYDSYGDLKVLVDKEGEFHVLYKYEESIWWDLKAVDTHHS